MDPVLLVAEDGEAIVDRPRRSVRVLFEQELLDASYACSEGGERGASPHIHLEHVDAFYVVEGEVSFKVGPDLDVVRAGPGTFVMVPPGLVHGFDNDSDATARWLNFHAPSTGFLSWMRGDRESFDMVPPPADGGDGAGPLSRARCTGAGGARAADRGRGGRGPAPLVRVAVGRRGAGLATGASPRPG